MQSRGNLFVALAPNYQLRHLPLPATQDVVEVRSTLALSLVCSELVEHKIQMATRSPHLPLVDATDRFQESRDVAVALNQISAGAGAKRSHNILTFSRLSEHDAAQSTISGDGSRKQLQARMTHPVEMNVRNKNVVAVSGEFLERTIRASSHADCWPIRSIWQTEGQQLAKDLTCQDDAGLDSRWTIGDIVHRKAPHGIKRLPPQDRRFSAHLYIGNLKNR